MIQKIALIGFGTVGQGLAEILLSKQDYLKAKYNFKPEIVAICDSRYGNIYNPEGLCMETVFNELKNMSVFIENRTQLTTNELITVCNADVVCEMTYTNLDNGGSAIDFCKNALLAGKHIVTCNKGPAAIYYSEMKKIAMQNNVKFLIEGTVMAGSPVLNLAEGPLAGCEIISIRGVLNGTSNFMLTEMENGKTFTAALSIAQQLGYAENNPSGDVEGYDAKAKVCILANVLMNTELKLSEINCSGITKITPHDIIIAQNERKRWKLIGSVIKNNENIKAKVCAEMIDEKDALYSVSGANCAITFSTDLLGDLTITGPGAGRIETGFAMLSDILKIHTDCLHIN